LGPLASAWSAYAAQRRGNAAVTQSAGTVS
jgi:hypothetical protein